jgi:hypothetical protein
VLLHGRQCAPTPAACAGTDDLDAHVKKEFGTESRLADWNDLRDAGDEEVLKDFLEHIGLQRDDDYGSERSEAKSSTAFVSCDDMRGPSCRDIGNVRVDQRIVTRLYFATRWDGERPGSWLAHQQLHGDTLCLGSWFGQRFRALATTIDP